MCVNNIHTYTVYPILACTYIHMQRNVYICTSNLCDFLKCLSKNTQIYMLVAKVCVHIMVNTCMVHVRSIKAVASWFVP